MIQGYHAFKYVASLEAFQDVISATPRHHEGGRPVAQRFENGFNQRIGIIRRDQPAGHPVADDFRQSAGVCGNYGFTVRESFQRHQTKRLLVRRNDNQVTCR